MKKKYYHFLLFFICVLSLCMTIVQKQPSPPCFNADEASFGYNAYSILKTGRDEYGTLLPIRLKSFGDFKLPLYSYLSIPFIALFGLNELGTRALNIFLSFFFPAVVYLFAHELFKDKKTALLSSFLSAISLGLHLMSRQAHEGYLAAFLTTLSSYFFLAMLRKKSGLSIFLFCTTSFFLLFSYHPGRLFVVFFLFWAVLYGFIQKQKSLTIPALSILAVMIVFTLTDFVYKPERLKNLAFFNNSGFVLKMNELKTEGGLRYLYNPLFIGLKDTLSDHLSYFSPQFLIQNGDANPRFGFWGMGIVTASEYLLFFAGLYFLFRKKNPYNLFLCCLIFITPLSASLSWSKTSLTRSLFLLVPLIILSSYGLICTVESVKKKYKYLLFFSILGCTLFLSCMDWDFYLFHYPKRLTTIHSWQCGYKQVGEFIKNNYEKYDRFYVTIDVGQPYIFLLFYLTYPPQDYQKQSSLTKADEYGFGQVLSFDKFIFSFKTPSDLKANEVVVASLDNWKNLIENNKAPLGKIKTITVNNEPVFFIYPSESK